MHSAILMVVMPEETQSGKMAWQHFSAKIAKPLADQAVEQLAYNIWQINFQASPVALAQLVAAADDFGFPYRVLPFDAAPQWILANPTKPVN
jgi:hypothetical protein